MWMPDSRVSRPISSRGDSVPCGSARTSAAPSRQTVGGSKGWTPATPRTPSVPNNRGTLASLFATRNPHVNHGRLDVRDAGVARRIRVDGQLVLADAEPAQID